MTVRACPLPFDRYPVVTLAHGGGGRLTQALIADMFAASFARTPASERGDAAVLTPSTARIAFTTDSYVVRPIDVPGGDIGKIAICGTCNDLIMAGARPRWLSVAFVLEEGLAMTTLWQVCLAIEAAATAAGVSVVAGDVKVVERGKGDGVFIATSGVGDVVLDPPPEASRVRAGDVILINGDVGRHGAAVMAARAEVVFNPPIMSDCDHLGRALSALIDAGVTPHWMRDATRGGLATVLVELAEQAGRTIEIDEPAIPVAPPVLAACELFGLDPLYVANEGRFVLVVPPDAAAAALAALTLVAPPGTAPAQIGRVGDEGRAIVRATTAVGGTRRLAMQSGEQLPRIC